MFLMRNRILKLCKTILQKISFDKRIYKKKKLKNLREDERTELKRWLRADTSVIGVNGNLKRVGSEISVIRQKKMTARINVNQKKRVDLIAVRFRYYFGLPH